MSDPDHPRREHPAPDEPPPPESAARSPGAETPASGDADRSAPPAFVERPAGEAEEERIVPEPLLERGAPASAPGDVLRGIRAALLLFLAAAAVLFLMVLEVRMTRGTNGDASIFFPVGLLIGGGGFAAALVTTRQLPPGARSAFWAMGVVCIFATIILWGVTCGMAGGVRID